MPSIKSVALVTVKRPGAMAVELRKEVADWLRTVAARMEVGDPKFPTDSDLRFRYMYEATDAGSTTDAGKPGA